MYVLSQVVISKISVVFCCQAAPGLMEDSASVKSNDSAAVSDEYEFVASIVTVSLVISYGLSIPLVIIRFCINNIYRVTE